VIPPRENFIENGTGVLSFPFIEGYRHCHPKKWEEWVSVLRKLLVTLTKLHEAEWVHLDIKPSNVLLRGNGPTLELFLIDFGLTEYVGEPSYKHIYKHIYEDEYEEEEDGLLELLGTYPYTDPIYFTDDVSIKFDMWSTGVMLAESILKEPFFESEYSGRDLFCKKATELPDFFNEKSKDSNYVKPEMCDNRLIHLTNNLIVLNREERWSSSGLLRIFFRIF
jgi:serine/threonine protein kinase